MFTANLCIIAKTRKQPRYPLVDEWINKEWYFQRVLKRNELSRDEKTWRNRQCVLLGERSQSEKIPHIGKGKTVETVKGLEAAREERREGRD